MTDATDEAAAPQDLRRARIAVLAAFLGNGLVAGSWSLLVPELMAGLGVAEAAIGLLILAGGSAGFAGLLAAPALLRRAGARAVCVGAGIALVPGLGLMAAAPSFPAAALAFVWLFLALSVMDVAMNAAGSVVERAAGRPMMSSFHGFWSAGAMIGAAAGGSLIAGAGPAGQAVAVGAAVAALVLLASRGLPRSDGAGAGRAGLSRDRRVWLLGGLALLAFICEGAVIDWSALYLRTEHGVGIELSGFAFAAFSAAMLAGRLSGDALARRFGPVRLFRASLLLAAAGYLAAGTAGSLPVALAGFLVAGLGTANLVPLVFSAAAGARDGPAAGIATATIMGYAGLLTAPATFGALGEVTGFAPIFAAFALPALGALALARLLAPKT